MAFGSFGGSDKKPKRQSHCLVGAVFKFGVKQLRPQDVYSIGRDPRSRIHLPSDTVSRRHATIRWTDEAGGGFIVEDNGSRNGVKVNNEQVKKQHFLSDEDLISINPFNLRYRVMVGDLDMIMLSETAGSEETRPLDAESAGMAAVDAGPDATLSGKFLGQELVEICQLIVQNKRTGVLEVKGQMHGGLLQFERGKLMRAEASRLSGKDAARALLTIPSGTFNFSRQGGKSDLSGEPIDLTELLAELAPPKDESAVAGGRSGSTTVLDVGSSDVGNDTLAE